MKILRRSGIPAKPVDFFSVSVEKEQKRCAGNAEFFINGFPDQISPGGPVQDEILFEELAELGIAVILLTQQFAAPSAARGEEIQ